MAGVLAFWLGALAIAAAALPIAFVLLRRFPDGGAGLAPVLGLVLTSYTYFILRTLDLLGPGRGSVLLTVAIVALVGAIVARSDRRFFATVHRAGPQAMLYAGLFTVAFFGYAAFRSYQSSIGGTEQPMDLMYLNAMLASPEYPPQDPWLAGEPASYYYFGYLQAAVLTSVGGVPASVGYNLGLAAVFASSATAVASVAAAIARWVLRQDRRRLVPVAAGTAVVLLLFASSLIGIFEWSAAHEHTSRPVYEAFGVENILPCPPGAEPAAECYRSGAVERTTSWYPTEFFFWWRGSRVIEGTITEFPFFSFLLGDLHPHVMSIPLVLLAMALAAATFRSRALLDFAALRRRPWHALPVALVLGALAFQNAWDVITFAGLFAIAVAVVNSRRAPFLVAATATGGYLGPIVIVAVVAYLPWIVTFHTAAGGIYPYVREGTPPLEALLQFGAPTGASLALLGWAGFHTRRADWAAFAPFALWVPVAPLLLWAPLAAYHGDLNSGLDMRGAGGWLTLTVLGSITWANVTAAAIFATKGRPAAVALAFASAATLLLYGGELFFVKDVFFGNIPRLNTVFKLSYQAWILMSVAGGVGLTALFARDMPRIPGRLLAAPVSALVLLALLYPVLAIPNRTNGFTGESSTDGFAALARNNPAEYALVRWISAEVPASATIVEAASDSYSSSGGGRVGSRTGRPTPIGWYFHEIQWRGGDESNHERFRAIQATVDVVYNATTTAELMSALDALDAHYVVLGSPERSRYPSASMATMESALDIVFEFGDVRVFAVPVHAVMSTS
jgi:YYY domain-containing protein